MKEVRVCEAMKSPVGTLSDGTVLHQQDGGTKSRQVPIWEKSNLTLEEAAAYSGIGINKLREITNEDKCKFVLWVGNKRLPQCARYAPLCTICRGKYTPHPRSLLQGGRPRTGCGSRH